MNARISAPEPSEDDSHERFLRLWTQNEAALLAFVRSCCPHAHEVDEVMQDVCIAAWRKFSTLDDPAAFGRWACMIARYELLMARRRHARDRLVLAEDVVKLLADEGEEEAPLRHQQLLALEECVEKLPRERRELALAAYGEGGSIRSLAAQLGRTEDSLYQLLSRIRKKLHRCVEETLTSRQAS